MRVEEGGKSTLLLYCTNNAAHKKLTKTNNTKMNKDKKGDGEKKAQNE